MKTSTEPNKHKKGMGSHYFRKSDQRWCATLSLPAPDGGRRRVTRTVPAGGTEEDAIALLRDLRREKDKTGDIPTKTQTVESWLNLWFTTIAVKKIRPKTASTYRSLLERHIIPEIGKVRLEKLRPVHVRQMQQRFEDKGLSSTTAMQAYRILSVALKYAEREGRVTRNAAELTDAPRRAHTALTVLSAADGARVLETVKDDRLGSRWWAALLTGARQGEALGLEIDRVGDYLDLSWQLQRIVWDHGCKTPCGKKRGSDCPKRKLVAPPDWDRRHLTGGLWLSRPKSNAGWRIIPLVDPLRSVIEQRLAVAATEPNPHGLVWTADPSNAGKRQIDGSPIDPKFDNYAWHAVLKRAGVPDARLHDARHTTASLLLQAHVPEAIIVKILGHSTYAMTRAYQNVNYEQLADAMTRSSKLMLAQ